MKKIDLSFSEKLSTGFKAHCAFVFSKDIFTYSCIGSLDDYKNGCGDEVDDFGDDFDNIHEPLMGLINEILSQFPELKSEMIGVFVDFKAAEIWIG